MLEELAARFKLKTTDAIARLRSLEEVCGALARSLHHHVV
jgi:hypothetical protein